MPISQQVVGGNSCGACAASYVLEQLFRQVLPVASIQNLWNRFKFDATRPGQMGWPLGNISYDHSDPRKITRFFSDFRRGQAALYIARSSSLYLASWLLYPTDFSFRVEEGMRAIQHNPQYTRAIGIYAVPGGLHYVLTRYEGGRYEIMDSNAAQPNYVAGPPLLSNNTTFGRMVNGGIVTYQYLGACIVVSG